MTAEIITFLDALELERVHAESRSATDGKFVKQTDSSQPELTILHGRVSGRSDSAVRLEVGKTTLKIPLQAIAQIEHAPTNGTSVARLDAPPSIGAVSDRAMHDVQLTLRTSALVQVSRSIAAHELAVGSHLLTEIPKPLVGLRQSAGAQSVSAAAPLSPRNLVTAPSGPRLGIPPRYTAIDIGPLPPYASHTYPTGINELGQVVGYAYEPGFPHEDAVLWTQNGTGGPAENPQLRGLGNFAGDDYWHSSEAYGLNNRGQVVGWANGTDYLLDPWHAFVWQAGRMTDLGTLAEYAWAKSMARAINDNGLVAGWSETKPGDSYSGNPHAFVYDLATGQMRDLGVDESWANSINAGGQVVGAYTSADGNKHALFWDPVVGARDLHDLVSAGGDYSEAAAINYFGQIVGWGSDANGIARAFCCNIRTGQVQRLGGDGESLAFDINNRGVVVGRFQYEYPSLYDHALLWDPTAGVARDLADLITDSGWFPQVAWSINDAGQVAGFAGHHIEEHDQWLASTYRLAPVWE